MGRFADIAAGTLARRRAVACTTLGGVAFNVDLRVLNALEEAQCLAAACRAAREAGGEPVETDLSYQLAFAVHIVALAAIDPDNQDAAVPFFESADQVRSGLDRERILLLAETHRRFQEQASPVRHELDENDFVAMVAATATAEEGDDLPFEALPRFTRNRFVRSMAVLLLTSQSPKSHSSSDSEHAQKH